MFAKALLRQTLTHSRHTAVNQLARSTVGTAARTLNMIAVRGFAVNTAQIEKSIQKLNKALEKEIKYENENYSKLDDIETYLNESGFRFNEQENGTVMTLTKTVGDKIVEVQFEAR